MRKLKLLAGLIVTVMVAAGVWWLIAARAQEAALAAWMEARRAAGWQAEAEISVRGFPSRLDLTLTEPALADPDSGWAWSASFLELAQVIYEPTFFVVSWPPEQLLAAPGARATLRTDSMRASLKTRRASALPLERASLDIGRAALAAEAGWTAGVERLTVHLRAAPEAGPENAYEFRADALRLRLPDYMRDILDPAGALPPAMETAAFEGRAALDRPLDRFAIDAGPPQLAQLSLREARAEWGALRLSVTGAMKADAAGLAEGEFEVSAENWREMLDAGVAAGVLAPAFAETLKAGLGFVARLSGSGEKLDVTLVFEDGRARIGPVPLGPAPRLLTR